MVAITKVWATFATLCEQVFYVRAARGWGDVSGEPLSVVQRPTPCRLSFVQRASPSPNNQERLRIANRGLLVEQLHWMEVQQCRRQDLGTGRFRMEAVCPDQVRRPCPVGHSRSKPHDLQQ